MPYIKQEDQAKIHDTMSGGLMPMLHNAGELNYFLTTTVLQFLYRKGTPRYQDMNDAIGALEGCKLELYRRLVGPYEDVKIEENGDVYPQMSKGQGY